jgi:hypothetical protein
MIIVHEMYMSLGSMNVTWNIFCGIYLTKYKESVVSAQFTTLSTT